MRNTSVRRVVLGPKTGPVETIVSLTLMVALIIPAMYFARTLLKVWGEGVARAVFAGIVPVAISLSYATRFILGFMVEIDDRELRIHAHGRVWPPIRLPLESVIAVEPWREDEPRREGYGLERGPRLHVQFVGGEGRLFGPWKTRDAQADYRRLRDLFGPLFRGEVELRR